MNLLLDTCVFLWTVNKPEQLPKKIWNHLVDPKNNLYISTVTQWEAVNLYRNKRIAFKNLKKGYFERVLNKQEIALIPLLAKDIDELITLPFIHKDPFDRMLICQALANNLTIVTPDKKIREYDVPVLW